MATIDDLKNNELFKGLSDSDLKEIVTYSKDKTFSTGEIIFTHEERGKDFFLLLDGDVKLQIPTEKEFGIAVVFVEVGSAFGISGLLEPYTYSSTAKCTTNAKVIAVEIDPFLDFISNKNIKSGFLIMKNLASILMSRLNTTRKNLRDLVSQVQISIP